MNVRRSFVFCVALSFSALSTSALAQKNITTKLYSGWKLNGDELQVAPNHLLFASTGYGVSFNSEQKGFLHGAYWICTSVYEIIGGQGNETGSCLITDQDGDTISTGLSSSGPRDGSDIVGTHTLKGGTGKYKGISGTISLRCTILAQFHQLACDHEATYSLP